MQPSHDESGRDRTRIYSLHGRILAAELRFFPSLDRPGNAAVPAAVFAFGAAGETPAVPRYYVPGMNSSPALVFDLDGTLVDTAPDILAALNAVLSREHRGPLARTDIAWLVGHGARAMLKEAFARTGASLSPVRMEALTDDFIACYRDHIADESRLCPGVEETLREFVREGARLGVLTNKPQELAELLLEKLGLAQLFTAVHGAGRYPYAKPDGRVFHHVMAEMGGAGAGALMIGDSATDVATARAAGVPVVLVAHGYTPVAAERLGADAVAEDFEALPGIVALTLQL